MLLRLEPRAKTIPSNYDQKEWVMPDQGEPGYSLTPEALDRARRRETEYTDWREYEAAQGPQEEHPEYRSRTEEADLARHWERIVRELEPMPRGV